MHSLRVRKTGVGQVDFFWLKENFPTYNRAAYSPVPDFLDRVKLRQQGLYGFALPWVEGG
jgi:hypothetical protein